VRTFASVLTRARHDAQAARTLAGENSSKQWSIPPLTFMIEQLREALSWGRMLDEAGLSEYTLASLAGEDPCPWRPNALVPGGGLALSRVKGAGGERRG
jgi:hypothetical protein